MQPPFRALHTAHRHLISGNQTRLGKRTQTPLHKNRHAKHLLTPTPRAPSAPPENLGENESGGGEKGTAQCEQNEVQVSSDEANDLHSRRRTRLSRERRVNTSHVGASTHGRSHPPCCPPHLSRFPNIQISSAQRGNVLEPNPNLRTTLSRATLLQRQQSTSRQHQADACTCISCSVQAKRNAGKAAVRRPRLRARQTAGPAGPAGARPAASGITRELHPRGGVR